MQIIFEKLRAHCSSMTVINWKPLSLLLKIYCYFIFVWTPVKALMSYSRVSFDVRFKISTNPFRNFRNFFTWLFGRLLFVALLTCILKHRSFQSFCNKISGDSIFCYTRCAKYFLESLIYGFSWLYKHVWLFVYFLSCIFLIFLLVAWLFGWRHQGDVFRWSNST
jgi:hypothetical protein